MSLENNEIEKTKENDAIESANEISSQTNIDNNLPEQISEEEAHIHINDTDIEEQNKMNKASKIVLYVVSAIIIILCLVVLAKNLFFRESKKESVSSSSTIEANVAPAKIKDLYVLDNLADGYELSSQDISDTKVVSTYKNKTNEIVFTQSTIKNYNPEYDPSDENTVVSYFSRGDGQDFTAYNIDKNCYIVWTTDEYTFEIKTTMKKSESIPFIFNVQKAETDTSVTEAE